MKILSWNCRGLGNPTAVRALKKLLHNTCPDVVFLSETKLQSADKKSKTCFSYGPLSNSFIVDCSTSNNNRSGGLALMWNNDVKVEILNANNMIIDAYITTCNSNNHWFATSFYGSSLHNLKHKTCDTINDLYHTRNQDSWLIFW
jgi:exonuclease III